MTRINWLRAGAVSAMLVSAFAQNAGAQVICSVTVTGLNDPAIDAGAVQSAVNLAGVGDHTVCLQGTFDFGTPPPGSINSVTIITGPLVTGLHIVGLNDANGKKATIRNGVQSLTKQGAQPPVFSIENLRFEQPQFSAISILGAAPTGSIKISGVNIVGVRTFLFPAFNARFREGISVSSGITAVGGDIEISNNVIDGGAYTADDTTLGVSGGIVLTGALPPPQQGVNRPFTARVRISDNKIVNWSGSGILAAGVSELTIEKNVIQPGAFANTIAPGCTAANGGGAGNGISLQSVHDGTVRDNVITLVPALTGAGIAPTCTAGLIVVGPTNVAPGMTDGTVLYRNRIRGSGTYAIVVGVTPAALPPGPTVSVETDNLFALNALGNFTPQNASLFIGPGAVDNAFVGNFPSIEGNVDGNTVISRLR
jgi:hypothetical protein